MVGSVAAAALPAVSSAATNTVADTTFNTGFTTMSYLKTIAAKGMGSIAVILPDTVSSARYTEFDAPYLKQAFKAAGLTTSQYSIQNAGGSDTTQYNYAQAAIARGAKVLVLDPLDSTTGSIIETYAAAHGVKVVDYDRLTLGGTRSYYVSFNNVAVGTLIGQGLVSCVKSWNVSSPMVYEMFGAPTDNNATLFAQGYNAVLKANPSITVVKQNVGSWTPSVALSDFQGAYTADNSINAVLTPNDANAAPIIGFLQSQGLAPKTIPFTGQDASLTGFQNVISGYQCGTVYKPIWLEAQAAALAIYLRAGVKPSTGLVNGTTPDSVATISSFKKVPSVLLTPTWVTADKIQKTVVADKVIMPKDLCTSTKPAVTGAKSYAQDCTTYGIH